jgi:hypothetical protein
MMKRALMLLIAVGMFYACNQQAGQMTEQPVEVRPIAELVSNPMAFEDHQVKFEGMIGHVCRGSGDKMRVVQIDQDAYSILVMLGDMAGQFNPEMEGSEVVVTGTLKTQVANMEALEEDHDHEHGHEGEDHACDSTEEAIKRLKEKGIDPDIRAYVELTNVEIK